jgi:hypothetical protein
MSITLTDQEKTTLRTAAHGAIALMSLAGVASSPHKIATNGSLALSSATGTVGHALAEKPKGEKLNHASGAVLADQVLLALSESMSLLKKQDPAEADNFRSSVIVAVEAGAKAGRGEPTPPMIDMIRKITEALDAA